GDRVETYERYSSPYLVAHTGAHHVNEVALTFDDGPDPTYTPRILDILRHERVPATFFVVGANVERSRGLLLRIYSEKHEIGNHTYFHPELAHTLPERLRFELNATQRLIQHTVGISTVLFRPPYHSDGAPDTPSEAAAIARAQLLGYLT